MNNWNPWEDQLRCWTPRRPSAKLSARLFSRPPLPPRPARLHKPRWGWLVPATGALWLAVMTLTPSGLDMASRANGKSSSLLASVTGGLSGWHGYDRLDTERNVLTSVFEWTNADSARGNLRSFLLNTTNGLRN